MGMHLWLVTSGITREQNHDFLNGTQTLDFQRKLERPRHTSIENLISSVVEKADDQLSLGRLVEGLSGNQLCIECANTQYI